MSTQRISAGQTPPEATAWQPYPSADGPGIYVDVDTRAGKFSSTPIYVTSLGGREKHWVTAGATSIYNATATGFRVYVRRLNGAALTPDEARSLKWHINWYGIEG